LFIVRHRFAYFAQAGLISSILLSLALE
jgi:hypothetical protein